MLAGERQGGNALAQEFSLPAGVLVPLGGQTCIEWALAALRDSKCVGSGLLCGPARQIIDQSRVFGEILESDTLSWLAPEAGPAASAEHAVHTLAQFPVLITTADHALLTGQIVDDFCQISIQKNLDLVVGLVPYDCVQAEFPESKRTLLRFSEGTFCGSNLFAVLSEAGGKALSLWQQVESERKTPWKIARRLSLAMMLRYITGRLSLEQVFQYLSKQSGCRVGYVRVKHARAAVDVDSRADWLLADKLLSDN